MILSRQQFKTYAACNEVRRATGMRSGLEVKIRDSLESQGCPYSYEPVRIPYVAPSTYTPDFGLPVQAIVLEGKGQFTAEDRQKLILVKQQHPDLDIRLVFSRSASRISKTSKTTYALWCGKHGFPYVDKAVPVEWLKHKPSRKQREAFDKLFGIKALTHGTT